MSAPNWWIYRGTGKPHKWKLPPAPLWRQFGGASPDPPATSTELPAWTEPIGRDGRADRLAATYRPDDHVVGIVNAAIYLRRPLLVTGPPGTGKSTLAHSIARELGLGQLLTWPISSRSTLVDGLYRYDAIGRLQEVTLRERAAGSPAEPAPIGKYLSLGPLGTALLPVPKPRVLLIDELDKGDVDLPNDLLSVFEDGHYVIPELRRISEPVVTVLTDDGTRAHIERGRVECAEFPIVVITTNGERQFPAAFTRRCVRLEIRQPDADRLRGIIAAHFGSEVLARPETERLVQQFDQLLRQPDGVYATDQLLNAVQMSGDDRSNDTSGQWIIGHLLRPLDDKP